MKFRRATIQTLPHGLSDELLKTHEEYQIEKSLKSIKKMSEPTQLDQWAR